MIFIAKYAFFAYVIYMQEVLLNPRQLAQAAFERSIKASKDFALNLLRFGYETRAMLNGDSVTATGRSLMRVGNKISYAIARLKKADSFTAKLAIVQSFNQQFNLEIAKQNIQNAWGRVSHITKSPSAETVKSEFIEVSAPQAVAELLIEDELHFEQVVSDIKAETDPNFIGPSAELFHAYNNSAKTHGLKAAFDCEGNASYAHCATKVASLTQEFKDNNNIFRQLIEPSVLVKTYGEVAKPQEVISFAPSAPQATNKPAYNYA